MLYRFFIVLLLSMSACTESAMNEFIALTRTDLAEKVAKRFKKDLHIASFQQFADGEVNVVVENPDRYAGKTAIIIQSTADPVNQLVLGVAFLTQELKNAGAKKVILVMPYFGYSRQERSKIKGKPGHAAIVAHLFETAGVDELLTMDLHNESIIDFFTIPVHNLSAASVIGKYIMKQLKSLQGVCLIAPDKGAAEYVNTIARQIGGETLIFSKERFATDQTRVVGLAGNCQGTTGVIIDDIIATGGTAIKMCNTLSTMGYDKIYGYFVHPVLAGNAVERINNSRFKEVFVGNTIPLKKEAVDSNRIKVFDVSEVIVNKLQTIVA